MDLREARGAQIGDGNVQQNFFAPVTLAGPVPVPVALHQLPPRIPGFAGRAAELSALADMLTASGDVAPVVVCAVSGLAGVGKTAVAVHAAHTLVDAGLFPGGVLFVDLHGYGDSPTPADQVLEALLRALGVDGGDIPPDPDARSALFRSRLASSNGPVLMLADNASTAGQVLPLLPGDSRHRVLVTSRHTLSLHARVHEVDVLDVDAAVELLDAAVRTANASDARVTAGATSAAQVAALCGYLPLALQIAAALLISDRGKTIAELADELAQEDQRMEFLDDGERAVRTAFDLSYRQLSSGAARLFRLLAANPGPDVALTAAVVLAQEPRPRVTRMLAELLRAHMIQRATGKDRWSMHDLLRDYARVLLASEPGDENNRQGRRLREYYLQSAHAASRLIDIRRDIPQPGQADRDDTVTPLVPVFTDRAEAMAWMEAERANLQATVTYAASAGDTVHAAAIAHAMAGFMRSAGYYRQAVAIHRTAVDAAAETRDPPRQGAALVDLGTALQDTGQFPEAIDAVTSALGIYEELRDDAGQALALTELGVAQRLTGRYPSAIHTLTRALALHQTLQAAQGQATVLGALGAAQRLTGDLPAALTSLFDALRIHERLADKTGQARVLTVLGAVQWETGDFAAASRSLTSALSLSRELSDRHGEAAALRNLGAVQWLAGDANTALSSLGRAMQIHTDLEDELGQAHALTFLGAVQRETGDFEVSGESLRRAIGIYRRLGDPGAEVEAVNHYAELRTTTGHPSEGRALHLSALDHAREIHSRWDEANTLCGLAAADQADGDPEGARAYFNQALGLYHTMGCIADVERVHAELGRLHGQEGLQP